MEKEKKSIYKKWGFWVIVILLIFMCIGSSNNNTNTTTSSNTENKINETQGGVREDFQNEINVQSNDIVNDNVTNQQNTVNLKYGQLQSFTISSDSSKNSCVIKAKIEPSYNNKATIHQNFYNVEDFIKNQDGNRYDEIQYWAVADMQSGEETKVISFTLDKKIIDDLYNNKIVANMLGNYLDDFWVIESLK